MDQEPTERRTETRYPIEAKVIVRRNSGEILAATAANISGGGMLLHFEQASGLRVGEAVAVDVELPRDPGKPLASWGLARVVRFDGSHLGVQLSAATFDPCSDPPDDPLPEP